MTPNIAATGTLTADDDFNVQWQVPDEARVCWVWDPNHFPYPFLPLAIDCGLMGADAIFSALGVPDEARPPVRFINGYCTGARRLVVVPLARWQRPLEGID